MPVDTAPPAAPAALPPDWEQGGLPAALVTPDGQLLRANRALALLLWRLCGVDDPLGDRWLALWPPSVRARVLGALAERRTNLEALPCGPASGATLAGADTPRWISAQLRWQGDPPLGLVSLYEVTPIKQAEWQARARGDALSALLDSTELMMAHHDATERRCTLANRAYAGAFRHSPATIIGCTLDELLGAEAMREIRPVLAQVQISGESGRHEMPLRLAGATGRGWAWTELNVVAQRDAAGGVDGFFITLTDITQRHETEHALLESEERLVRFLQAGIEGIVFHRDGVVMDANPAACLLLGYNVHELMGREVLQLVDPAQHEAITYGWRDIDESSLETAVLHRSGERIPVELIDRAPAEDAPQLRLMVLRDIRERRAAQAQVHYLTHHDGLTGLANREAFVSQLEHLMVSVRPSGTQLALLFVDLDHFKRVNESLGHAAGDLVIRTVARRLHEQLRSTDRLARFGADEFMVLLPGVRERGDVAQVARKLLTAIAAPLEVENQSISVTASVGIAVFPGDGGDPDTLIKHADAAMHSAKARGRATLADFDQAMVDSAYANLVLEGELGHAIEHSEFALHFQPQVRASDGQLVGVEALIRWQHPQRGLLAPGEFIGLAEQHRLILPISAWVLREAARCARQWHELGLSLTVAVNLSAIQFESPNFIASIESLLDEAALPRGWLELELTERMLMDDVPTARERLQRLRALGVKLSVDDFGTGYSSLAHLRHLPIDKMKVDRSFVQDLPDDRDAVAIATAIISLACGLGLTVVAEGVETEAQMLFFIEHGGHQLQGMGISPPLSADELSNWARERR